MSLYRSFCRATILMQPYFEQALQRLPGVSFIVSDLFLWWTLESANKFRYPRIVFSGMSAYIRAVCQVILADPLLFGPDVYKSDDDILTLPSFPGVRISRNDVSPFFSNPTPKGPDFELLMNQIEAASQSYGWILNSFYELEAKFVDSLPKSWCVGPLNFRAGDLDPSQQCPIWIQWLNQKLDQGISVLYVAFGTQAEISPEQLSEIAKGLELSKVNFLWVIRLEESVLGGDQFDSFEERVKDRGLVVKDWVDQREILNHQSVSAILAWPIAHDQPVNAGMVADEIKIGLRVKTSCNGFVKSQELEKSVNELMEGERGKAARKKVKELAAVAIGALEEGSGSSWRSLEKLIEETQCKCDESNNS